MHKTMIYDVILAEKLIFISLRSRVSFFDQNNYSENFLEIVIFVLHLHIFFFRHTNTYIFRAHFVEKVKGFQNIILIYVGTARFY